MTRTRGTARKRYTEPDAATVQLAAPPSTSMTPTQPLSHYQGPSSWATTNAPNLSSDGQHPYPDAVKPVNPKGGEEPPYEQVGATGVTVFSGILDQTSIGEYNPDFGWTRGIQIYDQMVRNDAMCKAIELQIVNPILRADWKIRPGSPDARDLEIAAFVESCLFHDLSWTSVAGRQMTQTWPELLRHMLTMLRYGFSISEVCYKKEDGWIKWARFTPIMARTVYKWWLDEHNDLVGVQFYTWLNQQKMFIDIPADKLLYLVYDQEGNNPEGQSIFRAAYKHWWYLDRFYAIEAVAIERSAVAPPVVKLPPNYTPAQMAAAKSIVQNVRVNEDMGITIVDPMDVEILKGSQRQAAPVQPPIEHHNYKIALAVLGQFLAMGGSEHGSYARSESELYNFLAAYQMVITYICAMLDQEIRRLVDYNFDGVEAYPCLTCSKLVAQDLETISKTWQQLQAGNVPMFAQTAPEFQKFFLDALGIPKPVLDPVQQQNPTEPSNPDRPQNQRAGDHGDDEGNPSQLAEVDIFAETMAEVYKYDAVERGMVFSGFDPSQHPHVPKGSPGAGRWQETGGHKSVGGKKAAGSKAGAAKKKASSGSAHLAPKKEGEEATAKGKYASHLPKSYKDLSKMEKIEGPHGANKGQWYKDAQGHEFYVKEVQSLAHAYNEVGAMKVYEAAGGKLGRDIPHTAILKNGSKAYIISQRIGDVQQYTGSEWRSEDAAGARKAAEKLWAADALMSHYDVVGAGDVPHSNMLIRGDGGVARIEAGGAMAYGGLGGVKGSWHEGAKWDDPWTMRNGNKGMNPTVHDVFGKMTDARASTLLGQLKTKLDLGNVDGLWEKAGMPKAQREENLKILKSRLDQVEGIQAQLKGSGKGTGGKGSGGAKKATAATKAPPKYKAPPYKVTVKDGVATFETGIKPSYMKHDTKVFISKDEDLGGYKIEYHNGTKIEQTLRGMSAANVNAFLGGYTGHMGIFTKVKADVPAGPKKTKAEKDAYQVKADYEKHVPQGGNLAEYQSGINDVQLHEFQGGSYHIHRAPNGTISVSYHENATPFAWELKKGANSWKKPWMGYDHGASEIHNFATEKEVNAYLKSKGVTNTFKEDMIAKPNTQGQFPYGSTYHGYPSGSYVPVHSSASSAPTKSAIYNIKQEGIGKYELDHGSKRTSIERNEDGFTIRHGGGSSAHVVGEKLSADEAKKELDKLNIDDRSHALVDMVDHEYTRYKSDDPAAHQARIDAVNARRDALDAKFGNYTQNKGIEEMKKVYVEYQGVRAALDKHLYGSSMLSSKSIASSIKAKEAKAADKSTQDELQAKAKDALARMHELSEWSLLHAPNVTREGTIRLYHGNSGSWNQAKWAEHLASGGEKRGVPFSDSFSVARGFAHGTGHYIISAHVPVENVITHYGIRGDSKFSNEHEYTVGNGKIEDYQFLEN